MPWRRVSTGFSAAVVAASWIASTALLGFVFGEVGFLAALFGLVLATVGLIFGFWKAVYGGGLQSPENAARFVPFMVGAFGVAGGLLFLFLSSMPFVGVLGFFSSGILGLTLWVVIILRDAL